MFSPLLPPNYPVEICDLQFRCFYSHLDRGYSNLGQNVINSPQEDLADSRCHENIRIVLDFLETYLNYIGLDGQVGIDGQVRNLIANINCADYCFHDKTNGKQKRQCNLDNCDTRQSLCELVYACFVPYEGREQFIFGQKLIDDNLESLSECLTIVAHEIFHAVTYFSCALSYGDNISAALHESYSDIFAVLVNNRDNSDIDTWNWVVGEESFNLTRSLNSQRDMSTYDDSKDCYHNMGIHNYAAFKIITIQDIQGEYLFNNKTAMLPILFYKALQGFGKSKRKVSKNFTDSRAAITSAALYCFGSDENYIAISEAIEHAFDSVMIPAPL